jgi:hypothetical protein
MAAQCGECAIDLFGEHGAGEFVRKSHGRERQQEISARLPIRRQTIMPSDEKDQVLRLALSTFYQLNEGWRVHVASSRIEEHLTSARVPGKKVETARNNLAHLAFGIARRTLQELRCNTIRMNVTRFADVINEELHALYSIAEKAQPKMKPGVPVRWCRR